MKIVMLTASLLLLAIVTGCTECCKVSADGGHLTSDCYKTYSQTCKTGYTEK